MSQIERTYTIHTKRWVGNNLQPSTLRVRFDNNVFYLSLCLKTQSIFSVTPTLTQTLQNLQILPYFENFYLSFQETNLIYNEVFTQLQDFTIQLEGNVFSNKVVDRVTKQVETLIEVGLENPEQDFIQMRVSLLFLSYYLSVLVCQVFPSTTTLYSRVIIKDSKQTHTEENTFWFSNKKLYLKNPGDSIEDIFVIHMLLTFIQKLFTYDTLPQCIHQSFPEQLTRDYLLNEWYLKPMYRLPFEFSTNVPQAPNSQCSF